MSNAVEVEVENVEGPRSFSVLLQQISDGVFHGEASSKLQQMLSDLREHASMGGKAKGKLTLTLAVSVEDTGIVSIEPDVTTKVPQHKLGRSVFWLTSGGNLSPQNPRQQTLPLREAPVASKPKEVGLENRPAKSV